MFSRLQDINRIYAHIGRRRETSDTGEATLHLSSLLPDDALNNDWSDILAAKPVIGKPYPNSAWFE